MSEEFDGARVGHLLRWFKQLACRGSVRQIDGDGICGHMRLFTSMDPTRLSAHLHKLFPGAPSPQYLDHSGDDAEQPKPQEALIRLLMRTTSHLLWSDEIEALTGMPARNLTRTARSEKVAAVMVARGFSIRTAKELGVSGKRKALIRTVEQPAAA
jgi:hypothetical protein